MPEQIQHRSFHEINEAEYISANAARHASHAAIELAKYIYWSFLFYHTHQITSVQHYHAKDWVIGIAIANVLPLTASHVRDKTMELYSDSQRQQEWRLHLAASLVNSIGILAYRYLSEKGFAGHVLANMLIAASAMVFGKHGYQPVNEDSSIAKYKQRHTALKCNLTVSNLLSAVWPAFIYYCGNRSHHSYKMKVATYVLLGSAMLVYASNIMTGLKLQRHGAKLGERLEMQHASGYDGPPVVADDPVALQEVLMQPCPGSGSMA